MKGQGRITDKRALKPERPEERTRDTAAKEELEGSDEATKGVYGIWCATRSLADGVICRGEGVGLKQGEWKEEVERCADIERRGKGSSSGYSRTPRLTVIVEFH